MDVLTLDADGPVPWILEWQADGVVALFVEASLDSVVVEDLEGAVLVADAIKTEWIKTAAAID